MSCDTSVQHFFCFFFSFASKMSYAQSRCSQIVFGSKSIISTGTDGVILIFAVFIALFAQQFRANDRVHAFRSILHKPHHTYTQITICNTTKAKSRTIQDIDRKLVKC